MAYAGKIIEDPITKQRITFLKTARDTSGELLRFEVRMAPGGSIHRHMHPVQQERIEIVFGTPRCRIKRREKRLTPGETLIVNPGEAHEVHNDSGEDAALIIEARPALETERGLETIFRLAKEGKTNHKGRPKNLLQRGIFAYDSMNEVAVPAVPLFVQRAIVAPMAGFGYLLGHRPRHSRYADDDAAL